MLRALNGGCGGNVKKSDESIEWINIDLVPQDARVKKMDIRKLEFPDEYFDLVYFSHCLEHISREQCSATLKEWIRVLKKGGRIKIGVPNFDMLAQYLAFRKLDIDDVVNYIYGNQREEDPGSFHKNGFDKLRLVSYLQPLGIGDFKSFKGSKEDGTNSIFSLNLEGTKL